MKLDEIITGLHDLSITCETNYQTQVCDCAIVLVKSQQNEIEAANLERHVLRDLIERTLTAFDNVTPLKNAGLVQCVEYMAKELKEATYYGKCKDETATIFMNQVKKLQEENEDLRRRLKIHTTLQDSRPKRPGWIAFW